MAKDKDGEKPQLSRRGLIFGSAAAWLTSQTNGLPSLDAPAATQAAAASVAVPPLSAPLDKLSDLWHNLTIGINARMLSEEKEPELLVREDFKNSLPWLISNIREFSLQKEQRFTGTQKSDAEVMETLRQASAAYRKCFSFYLQSLAACYPDDDPRFTRTASTGTFDTAELFGEKQELLRRIAIDYAIELKEAVAAGLEKLSTRRLELLKANAVEANLFFQQLEPDLYARIEEKFNTQELNDHLSEYYGLLHRLAERAGIRYDDLVQITQSSEFLFHPSPHDLAPLKDFADKPPQAEPEHYELLDAGKCLEWAAQRLGTSLSNAIAVSSSLEEDNPLSTIEFIVHELPTIAQQQWEEALRQSFPEYKGPIPHIVIDEECMNFAREKLRQSEPQTSPPLPNIIRTAANAANLLMQARTAATDAPGAPPALEVAAGERPALPAPDPLKPAADLSNKETSHSEKVLAQRRDEGHDVPPR